MSLCICIRIFVLVYCVFVKYIFVLNMDICGLMDQPLYLGVFYRHF